MSSYPFHAGAGAAVVGSAARSDRRGGASAYRLGLVAITTFVFQHCIVGGLRIHGAQPDLMLGLVVLVALEGGPRRGALFGFGVGLAVDLFVTTPFGLSALVFTLLGYAAGLLREALAGAEGAAVTTAVAGGGAIVGTLGFAIVLAITGGTVQGLVWVVLTVTLFNAIAAVPLSVVVRWAGGSSPGARRSRSPSRSRSGAGGVWR